MPASRRRGRSGGHTEKAERQAEHIAESAKKEGRYKGREKAVAWATVHKTRPKSGHREPTGRRPRARGARSR